MVLKILFGLNPDWQANLNSETKAAGYEFHMARLKGVDFSKYDLVVPLTLQDRADLDKRVSNGESVHAVFCSTKSEELCHGKLAFNQAMVGAGFGRNILKLYSSLPESAKLYPVIIRQRKDVWGLNSKILTSPLGAESAPVVEAGDISSSVQFPAPRNGQRNFLYLVEKLYSILRFVSRCFMFFVLGESIFALLRKV